LISLSMFLKSADKREGATFTIRHLMKKVVVYRWRSSHRNLAIEARCSKKTELPRLASSINTSVETMK